MPYRHALQTVPRGLAAPHQKWCPTYQPTYQSSGALSRSFLLLLVVPLATRFDWLT